MAAQCVWILPQVLLLLLLFPGTAGDCIYTSYLDLEVTTPGSLEALSGSCLQIPCNFTTKKTFDVSKSVFGVWMRKHHDFVPHPEYVIFNSSLPINTYPMIITGDLREKDCTTLFYNLTTSYSNTYYFRIENRPYLASAVCDPLKIKVTDSPRSPSIEVFGEQKETEVVTITCSAVTPCPHAPPQLTWDLHQGTVSITETNPDGTVTTKTKLNIALTDSHDGQTINCSAAYPVSGGFKIADSSITLSVTYGPKNTSVLVSPPGSLSAGQSVTLSCSSRANPPVHSFTWFTHSSQGPVSVSEGHTYNFSICDGGDFYCVAANALGNESSPVTHLRITDALWRPSIEVSGEQTENEVVTITCSAVTPCPHAPPQLTWDLHQGTVSITETNPDGTVTTKTKLNIALTDSHDGQMIKCSAAYPVSGGVKMADSSITLSVTYGPKDTSVEVSPPGSLSAGQSVTLSCSSRANPPVHSFTWFTHSSQGPVSVSEGHTYHFNLTEDGHFYCVASNGIRNESSAIINLHISEDEASAVSTIGVYNIVQLFGVVLLYSSLLIFECWLRAAYGKKPEQGPEPIHVNQVVETQT